MLFTNLVQANLNTRILGKHIEYYTRLESTNSEAWELINDGCENGTVIVTDNQYSGKGRGNRNWYAAPNKSLSFSIVLSPNINSKFSNWIPLISCIAIQKAVAAFSTTVEFKYPNDIMFGKKKLGGILCESKVSEKKIPLTNVIETIVLIKKFFIHHFGLMKIIGLRLKIRRSLKKSLILIMKNF